MFLRPFVAPLDKGANRGRCGIEDIHPVTVDDFPETVGLGKVGRAFIHQTGRSALQGAIDDIAVSGDPSDVGSTPVGVFFLQIENLFHAVGSNAGSRPWCGRLPSASRLFRRCRECRADVRRRAVRRDIRPRPCHQVVPPMIAALGLKINRCSGALVNDNVLHGRTCFQCFFYRGK